MPALKSRRKTCRDCGGTDDVMDGLCAACESENYVWCEVCREHHSREDDDCRHLFWTDCGHNGAGAYEDDWDQCRASFHRLLDLLATVPRYGRDGWDWSESPDRDLVAAIARRIAADNFWTFFRGFMLSMPDVDFVEGRTNLHPDTTCLPFAHLRGSVLSRWQEQHPEVYEAAGDGFAWLQSLFAADTPAANARTLRWIMDWRAARKGA